MKIFFKLYFWLVVSLFFLVAWLDATDEEPPAIIDFLDYLFWVVIIAGVFGYCYSRKILRPAFWKLFLPFIILWDICILHYEALNPETLPDGDGLFLIVLVALFYLGIALPAYIAIYLYGYKNAGNAP